MQHIVLNGRDDWSCVLRTAASNGAALQYDIGMTWNRIVEEIMKKECRPVHKIKPSWLDCYSVVMVSYVPSEDGPFGPKHVKDLRS
jgi:hypothetical protein